MSSPTEVPTLMRSTTPLRLPSLPMRIFLPHRRRRHLKFRPPSPSPAPWPWGDPPLRSKIPSSTALRAPLDPILASAGRAFSGNYNAPCSQHLFRNRNAASCAPAIRLPVRCVWSTAGVKWLSTGISSGCVWSTWFLGILGAGVGPWIRWDLSDLFSVVSGFWFELGCRFDSEGWWEFLIFRKILNIDQYIFVFYA